MGLIRWVRLPPVRESGQVILNHLNHAAAWRVDFKSSVWNHRIAHHNCARLMSTRRVPSRSVSAESSEKSMSSSPWRERRLTVEHPRVQLVLTALSCSSHARFEVLLFQQLPPYSKRQWGPLEGSNCSTSCQHSCHDMITRCNNFKCSRAQCSTVF